MRAEFEEKTFEVAANNEFGLLGAPYACPRCSSSHCMVCGLAYPPAMIDIWAPGQVLEGVLGFDVLVDIHGDVPEIAELLGVAFPAGMQWKQHFGFPPRAGAAPDWASLFLQYKRPEYFLRRRGKLHKLFPGPYFRFDLLTSQHSRLVRLRAAANEQALVYYAAPRFHTNADMQFYRQSRLVLARTAFIEAGGNEDHEYGAYDEDLAFLCSEPIPTRMYELQGMLAALRRLDLPIAETPSEGFRRHLDAIANAVSRRSAAERQEEQNLEEQVRSILTFAARERLVWLLASVVRRER